MAKKMSSTASSKTKKAEEYGYSDRYSKIIGKSQALNKKSTTPVAKITNKARKKIGKPTRKATYV